jgi:hypothetical protein
LFGADRCHLRRERHGDEAAVRCVNDDAFGQLALKYVRGFRTARRRETTMELLPG